ncbi:MAG: alpha/beta hydrolase, partial [Nanoarchaeota archaeon]|nr:alpha/beta hydrolase [Nanoarchaeota archaeon]
EISSKILTNPFCETTCEYSFLDLSKNNTVEKGEFIFKNSEPFSKKYPLTAPSKGTGQIFYRFEMNCASSEGFLCRTKPDPFYQSTLIVLEYDLTDEETIIKNTTQKELTKLLENFGSLESYFSNVQTELNSSSLEIKNINETTSKVLSTKNDAIKIKDFWELGEYRTVWNLLEKQSAKFVNETLELQTLKNDTEKQISKFNELLDKFHSFQINTSTILQTNFSDSKINEARNLATQIITIRDSFLNKSNISEKTQTLISLENNITKINVLLQEDSLNNSDLNNSLDIELNITFVESIQINKTEIAEIEFSEQKSQCCLFGECETCTNKEDLYPVIFLHGHDFSSRVSAEYNLNLFGKMQKSLEKDGLLNAGTILINVPEEIKQDTLSQIPWPVSIKASYYFDSIREEGELSILQTKKDNIDTYAIRLKNIIDSVQKRTGKNEVTLVTHSMGGLVARRYIQIFGEQDIHKIIMVSSPNHGIGSKTYNLCKAFGESKECDDMEENSLFLNKLKNQQIPKIEVHNIIGVGCDTNGVDGDGIVKKDSATLNWTTNYIINGTCNGFEYLHSKIVYPKEYPKTYKTIRDILF